MPRTYVPNWLENGIQDIRFGLRTLRKNPGFAAVAVATLALGIGANTAIFSVVKSVLLNPLPYPQPTQLVRLAAGGPKDKEPTTVSYTLTQDWKDRSHSFQTIAAYSNWTPTLTGDARAEILRGMRVTHNFFSTLGIPVALGRDFTESDDRPDRRQVVLLSYEFWKNRFAGSAAIVGRTITLSQLSYEVVGVLPRNFDPLIFRFFPEPPQIWSPLGYRVTDPPACRACRGLRSVARLAPGSTVQSAQNELDSVMPRLVHEFSESYPPGFRAVVTPLQSVVIGDVGSAVWMLFASTGIVLLIACVNVASLLLSRATARRREMSVRLALGCSRGRLLRQILTESTVLTSLGGAAGVLLASPVLHSFLRLAPPDTPRLSEIQVDPGVLLFTLIVALIAGQLAGLIPALSAASVDQLESLQISVRGSGAGLRRTTRGAMIVLEVALAFVLTLGAGLLLHSFTNVLAVHPGFDIHNLFTTNLGLVGRNYAQPASVSEFDRQLLDRIESDPGIDTAAIVSTLPLSGAHDRRGLQIEDKPLSSSAAAPLVDAYFVSADFFQTMGISLKQGHLFTSADFGSASAPTAIISESASRLAWSNEDPIGKHIQLGASNSSAPWATIIGVVADVRQYGLDSAVTPEVYLTYPQSVPPLAFPTIVIRSRLSPRELETIVEQNVAALDKTLPVFLPATMKEVISDSVAHRRFVATLTSCFGALALILAALGVYGVMSYLVARRTSEIGIRMALGATPVAVLRGVLKEGMGYVGVGIVIGALAAWPLVRVIKSQLFGIGGLDKLSFFGAGSILCLIALVACCVPARRATRVDPLTALRDD